MNTHFLINSALNELSLRREFKKAKILQKLVRDDKLNYEQWELEIIPLLAEIDLLLKTHEFNIKIINSMVKEDNR